MNNSDQIDMKEQPRTVAALLYGGVMLAALAIGLYGLFSLLWLANSAFQQGSQAVHF